VGEPGYLIRYGVMGYVGRFRAWPGCDPRLERGQVVVLRTDRGVELGEILAAVEMPAAPDQAGGADPSTRPGLDDPDLDNRPRVLRPAGPDDLARSRRVEAIRPDRFALCQRILREEGWPWELIDVEPMLDDRSTVLLYLGPRQLDSATVRARIRMTYEFDVLLEPVGDDPGGELEAAPPPAAGDPHCGNCDCSDGGCRARAAREPTPSGIPAPSDAHHGCSTTPNSGCASCGISRLLGARRERSIAGAR
jgi:hypothetical protein